MPGLLLYHRPMTDIGARFRALHTPGDPFILANAWDVGSAKVLASLGAQAIGTSSAAHAFTLGRPDLGHVTRTEALDHARLLVEATDLPVSGDFENGFASSLEDLAETVRLGAEAGLAGISIEDTDLPGTDAYEYDVAVSRVEAAVAAARSLDRDFFLVARADGVMHGSYDMAEAIRRITAFERVGADCVYVPMPPDIDALKAVCRAVDIPVNALAAGRFTQNTRAEFASAGVARISLGSSLARVTHRALVEAARPLFTDGDFSKLGNGASGEEIDRLLS